MNALEFLQSVQFVGTQDKRFAVIEADEWEALIEWLETIEDLQILRQASSELQTAGGDRQKAGWLEWDAIVGEL